ncbi:hypothetical protein O7632_12820 [Solwaraspora sp. WMMD406]|uniref:hypothetical protein n=1 Tax=Solwaraspora sp. WMMD406 TaxID=3016095 RepID=UPI002416299F|nr:hypothetical protein [Solwaraspora sp. WMMD406]MDG4764974.1 hypothetical protein [Solwaraspora sp. WMMD406]
MSLGSETVRDLPVSYRYGLANRLVHLMYRATWPVSRAWPAYLVRVLLLILRPVLTLLPLVAGPARAAAVVLLVLLTVDVAAPGGGRL